MNDYYLESNNPIDLSDLPQDALIHWLDGRRVNIRLFNSELPDYLQAIQVFPTTPDNIWL